MKGWIVFIFVGLTCLLASPDDFRGGILDGNSYAVVIAAGVFIAFALLVRPVEESLFSELGDRSLGCVNGFLGAILWGSALLVFLYFAGVLEPIVMGVAR